VSGPAFWRVTLTWPKPDHWADIRELGYLGWKLRHREDRDSTFRTMLPAGTLESVELRDRTVRMIVKVPAQPPRERSTYWHTTYASSAQIAVEWTVRAAQFGAGVINPRFPDSLDEPLPEPVRIKVEAA
jgi:hypothetical protein